MLAPHQNCKQYLNFQTDYIRLQIQQTESETRWLLIYRSHLDIHTLYEHCWVSRVCFVLFCFSLKWLCTEQTTRHIAWINASPVHWRVYAWPGLNDVHDCLWIIYWLIIFILYILTQHYTTQHMMTYTFTLPSESTFVITLFEHHRCGIRDMIINPQTIIYMCMTTTINVKILYAHAGMVGLYH